MIVEPLPLQGACLLRGEPAADARGDFVRIFCEEEFARQGLRSTFPQQSISHNLKRGTLRGLHYQEGTFAETKVVRCVRGRIFDVIVDLRPDSDTCGRWHGVELSADNGLALYVPEGFAHGFIALEDHSDVLYQITPAYQPGHGRTLLWNDPVLGITWPLQPVIMSEQDQLAPGLIQSLSRGE